MEFTPDRSEILRYLGYQNHHADEKTEAILSQCLQALQTAVKPRYTYRIFTVVTDCKQKEILLKEASLRLPGQDIYKHLKDCKKCAVMAATLGIEADNLIRIAQAESMTRALLLDACATELVEKLCDQAEKEISALAAQEGFQTNFRFSPGYGDLPLSLQTQIGEVLDTARRIGLTITEHSLLIPKKSVTAFLGFTKQPDANTKSGCAACSMQGSCRFRKEGLSCGH